ncbi:MAG TPA: hypothetical protein VKZ79_05465 [Alphaproteobacteria bacterium]|nr:hypothetical protein [Alphaproteobacteria bacterium]
MRNNWLRLAAVMGVAGSIGLSGVARADPHDHDWHDRDEHDRGWHDHDWRGHDFHGRDFRYFRPEERELWRTGRWIHDWHDGRFGWWWDVGGIWYYYPQPIYPYPTYVPPPVVAEAAPEAPPPAQGQTWYYCDNPRGYYPYVQSCPTPWREVPAAPPAESAPEGPPPEEGPQ